MKSLNSTLTSDDTDAAANGPVASATQMAYQAMRDMILTGALRPGEKLKIESLKDKLQIGSSPVREALSLLVSDQLVERLDQRGFRAASADPKDFQEILKLRCTLEAMALRESIANADDKWEDELVLAHHRMARVALKDVSAFEDHHRAFHFALLARCDSPILLRYCGQLYDLNVRYRYLAGRSRNYGKRDVAHEHQQIMEAAITRDADLAVQRLLEHYQATGSFLGEVTS